MNKEKLPAESETDFDYHHTENAQLKFFRRWTKILIAVSTTLLVICGFLLLIAIISGRAESRLKNENDSLKQQVSLLNSVETGTTTSSQNLIEKLDTTKLLTKDAVGENQIPDHFVGDQNAAVVVIEYGDFACSACQRSAAATKQIHQQYSDKVLFIQRSFSLDFPNSEITLSAAEAAYLVGGETAYQQMNTLLYQDEVWSHNQLTAAKSLSMLSEYADEIGLNSEEFNKALADRANNGISAKIARDKQSGQAANIRATPTRIVNGQIIEGASESALRAAIESALANAR